MSKLLDREKLKELLVKLIDEFKKKKEEIEKKKKEKFGLEYCAELTELIMKDFGSGYKDANFKDLVWNFMGDQDLLPFIEEYMSLRVMSKATIKKLRKQKAKLSKKTKNKKVSHKEKQLKASHDYLNLRRKLVLEREEKGDIMYPHKFHRTMRIDQFVEKYAPVNVIKKGEILEKEEIRLAGRVMRIRDNGEIVFLDLHGDGKKVQIFSEVGKYRKGGKEKFEKDHKDIGRGDIVGVVGFPGRTNPKGKTRDGKERQGELSIFTLEIQILTPCLEMIPKRVLKDKERRYRQRYLDLIMNKRSREIILTRSKVVSFVRRFFEDRDFVEVETPCLQMQAGGATARPFITHHNELNIDMTMRVAPELFLKMCIVGGIDRCFEIGKNFRNEGIDLKHNPEFTMCEFYWAYADYNDLMDLTEILVSSIVHKIHGSYKFKVNLPHEKSAREIDFSVPWKRVSMISELEKIIGGKMNDKDFKFPRPLGKEENEEFLEELLEKLKVECNPPMTISRMIDELVGEFIEKDCFNPTFICDHPQIMSPLAKWNRKDEDLTERFELMVCGMELCNAYTELNSPRVQRERFESQMKDKEKGDDEAQPIDENFIKALEFGLPPTAGWGMGIDRLTMILCNTFNIKEVIIFPAMKPEEKVRIKN